METGRPMQAVTCMRRRQGIPVPPAGLVMEDLREPIPSSIAAAPMAVVFMEGDSTEGMEAMEVAGTGDRIRRC